jgi:hypothetical protein
MVFAKTLACSVLLSSASLLAQVEPIAEVAEPAPILASEPVMQAAQVKPLPAGTPVVVSLDAELSTQTSLLGDSFAVTVVYDVMQDGVIVIPKGTRGRGEITFVTKKGAFGKPGIIGIALRDLDLNGRQVLLDGRFREEGGNNNGAAAATMFAVGVFAAVVKGKMAIIPAGRELKGRTGEDISVVDAPVPASTSMAAEPDIAQVDQPAPAPIAETPN